MDVQVLPTSDYSRDPFVIKVAYNDTVDNLLYTISLKITNVSVNEFEVWYKGKRLHPLDSRLNQHGLSHGESIELRKVSACCQLL